MPKDRWRENAVGEGGGLLLDLGSHLVDAAMQLFGPVATVRAEGTLPVEEVPLLVLGDGRPEPPVSDDVRIRILTEDDGDLLADANACAHVGFGSGGTAVGSDGVAERDAARKPPPQRVLNLIASGDAIVAVAETPDGVVCTGRAIPVGDVAEIVGVATLPVARRRGIGAALTAALVDAALEAGVRTLFLTARTSIYTLRVRVPGQPHPWLRVRG